MRKLKDLNIKSGDRVLLRVDFNVAVEDGKVVDDFRVKSSIPTIEYLQKKGAKVLILSHLGRPDGKDESLSLKPVTNCLGKLMGSSVVFFNSTKEAEDGIGNLKNGEAAVLENLRFDSRETEGSEEFAKELAVLGDLFVYDAFGVAHRKHTSVYFLPKIMQSAAGFLMEREIEVLNDIRNPKQRPLVFVMGGAKVRTKLKTLIKMMDRIDGICLGGLLANTILEEKGYTIGKSWKEEDVELENLDITNIKLHLPLDVVVSTDPSGKGSVRITGVGNVKEEEMILDAGPETVELFSKVISSAGTIVWNGPLGLMEVEEFQKGTFSLAESLKGIDAKIIVGGGDIMQAIDKAGAQDYVDYASTGGGAMLEYLAEGTLPAVEVLE